jgi:hypothetical protein
MGRLGSNPRRRASRLPATPRRQTRFRGRAKKRTLTHLYNARPTWLTLAHEALDKTVAAAYGWPNYSPEMSDEDILRQLLALKLDRSQLSIQTK